MTAWLRQYVNRQQRPAPVTNPLLLELSRKHQQDAAALRANLTPVSANALPSSLIKDETTLQSLIRLWGNNPTELDTEVLWQLLAAQETVTMHSPTSTDTNGSPARDLDAVNHADDLTPLLTTPQSPSSRKLTDNELHALVQTIVPLLIYRCLTLSEISQSSKHAPDELDDEGQPRQNALEAEPSRSTRTLFYLFALLGSVFWIMEGTVGGYELFQYFGKLIGHVVNGGPVGIVMAIVFGLVAFSMISVVDLTFVAQSMGVPYLEAKRELKTLLHDFHLLNDMLEELKIKLYDLNLTPEALASCKELRTTINQQYQQCQMRFQKIQTGFERSKTKRRIIHLIWMVLAACLYAGSANLTATTVLGVVSAVCPMSIAITAGIALVWMSIELYRFYNFEQNSIASATDALFGTPRYEFASVCRLSKAIEASLATVETLQTFQDTKQTTQQSLEKSQQELAAQKAQNLALQKELEASKAYNSPSQDLTAATKRLRNPNLFRLGARSHLRRPLKVPPRHTPAAKP